ncbi:galactokinase 2 [Pelomyxa schiedti]|nr:galactokinase 2 [Pelomyxa schiedti]
MDSESVCEKYQEVFVRPGDGRGAPLLGVTAPGRVNLIGEHIDYCGYGVLPFALEQNTFIVCGLNGGSTLEIHNLDNERFPPRSVSLASLMQTSSECFATHHWTNYIIAGFKGAMEATPTVIPLGINMMVRGKVPIGAGLSSSSSLVVAGALVAVYMHHLEETISKTALASLCATAEHYIGTIGGGMDQAISLLAEKGSAKYIGFHPNLHTENVSLPNNAVFVIVNSLVESDKYKSATTCYNMRVTECTLAAAVLAHCLGIPPLANNKNHRLIDIQHEHFDLAEMPSNVTRYLHREPYSIEEISSILGLSREDVVAKFMRVVVEGNAFELHKRAMHVYTEAQRVLSFKEICTNRNAEATPNKTQMLGSLMYESHASCKDLYACSCPELDTIVETLRNSGACGARLTGAGWGGCCVALLDSPEAARCCADLCNSTHPGCSFVTSPAQGASAIWFA